jgi:hypothetical protein
VRFFGGGGVKGLNTRYIHKEIFSVNSGKCLSCKAVNSWVEKGLSKVAYDARPVAEVAETTVKRFYAVGFERTGEAMRQVYQCW